MITAVNETTTKGQKILEFIEEELKKFNLSPSTIGLLTSYVLVQQNVRPDMDESQVDKVFDTRSEDIKSLIERRFERSDASGPKGQTYYEKGALTGLANLRGVK